MKWVVLDLLLADVSGGMHSGMPSSVYMYLKGLKTSQRFESLLDQDIFALNFSYIFSQCIDFLFYIYF